MISQFAPTWLRSELFHIRSNLFDVTLTHYLISLTLSALKARVVTES